MGVRFRLRLFTSMMLLTASVGMLLCFSWSLSSPLLSRWGSVRPCACRKCLIEGDSCFEELVRESPKPFLSRTFRPNEDNFNWWRKLQGSKCNFTMYNATLDEVFRIINPFPHVVGPSPQRCITCAVVGNSGTLNGSRSGSLIDSHDIVMRMNRGRTKGFEVDVGTKTTHHAFYPESATKLSNTTYLIFFPFKFSDFAWFFKKFGPDTPKSRMLANKDLVMIANPAIMRYTHQEWLARNGYWPSTGFLTFVVSLYMCDQVDLFGFGADKDGNWNHYFEILRNKKLKTGAHPGEYEYNTISKLSNKKKIQFFKGW